MLRHCFAPVLLAALLLTFSNASAQGLGGFLDKAKAETNQLDSKTSTASSAQATSQAVQTVGQDCAGPPPPSPSAEDLTVDNNIAWTETLLANCRPLTNENDSESDHNWRRLHLEFKAPLRFTWDRSYVEKLTPKKFYLMGQIENLCLDLMDFYNPNLDFESPLKTKLTKVKRLHLTTTTQAPHDYGADQGYVLGWVPATGTVTIAIATPPGQKPNFSNLHGEDLRGFIKENVK